MRKIKVNLGGVEFDVVSNENPVDSATVTDNPVESGQDVSDHIKDNPSTIDITGVFVKEDAPQKLQALKQLMADKEPVLYQGRNAYNNMVITSISRNHNASNILGFAFDISLKQVRIANLKTVDIKVVSPNTKKPSKKTNTKVKKTSNKGKQQTKSKTTPPVKNTPKRKYGSESKSPFKEVRAPGGRIDAIMNTYKPKSAVIR